jgi:SAM-dependent methyltransferase
VGLSTTRRLSASAQNRARDTLASARSREVIWHDLECGSYRADLPLWRELAAQHQGPVLDIGAGSGRVTLELARAGHAVTALERERVLLEALRGRPGGEGVRAVCADARRFRLKQREYALCIVPMQTIQLLGGAAGRFAFLRRARAVLRPGGLLACAILARVEPFACADGEAGPAPESAVIDGWMYASRPTRVAVARRSVVIERERRILAATEQPRWDAREGECARGHERSVIELDRLTPRALEREARCAGLRPEPAREVAPTEDHAGSTVVMLRA